MVSALCPPRINYGLPYVRIMTNLQFDYDENILHQIGTIGITQNFLQRNKLTQALKRLNFAN